MKKFIIKNALESAKGHHPCVKQSVYAMIETVNGDKVFGTNKMMNDSILECPRVIAGCKTGEGYNMCIDICQQISHAEVDAINNAKKNNIDIVGSKLTLVGHTYCCDNCTHHMKVNGIKNVDILDENGDITTSFSFYE